MAHTHNFDEALSEARALSDELLSSLPDVVPAGGLSLHSRLPFKATSIRELLIHRMADLCSASILHIDASRPVPAIILVRAAIEAVAVIYCLNKQLESFLSDPNEDKIDSFLTTMLVGARWKEHAVQSINIMTLLDKAAKDLPAIRDAYDNLSEYAHPNWSGLLGSYGSIDHTNVELVLVNRDVSRGLREAALALSASLFTFRHLYNLSADHLAQFNAHFERHGTSSGDA